ncbi:hypothetical protein EJ07DRAFT_167055 [Lizonia empirigonia]|nr:hypothetical protein EJ07DRAFT_167055 [Lizonia empirigonia]
MTLGEEDPELDKILQEQHNTNFKFEYGTRPFWRLLILQDPGIDNEFMASFVFHHAIGDGVAGAIFHRDFRSALQTILLSSVSLTTHVAVSSETTLLPPLEELHPLPIDVSSADSRTAGLKEWTGNPIHAPCTIRYRSLYLSPSRTEQFVRVCKGNGLSLSPVLAAVIAGALFKILPSNVEALTGIVPVNLRPWLDLPRDVADAAMGTFIDAFKVQLRRSDYSPDDRSSSRILPAAQHVAQNIKRYLTGNISPSGEPYTAVAIFKTIPDVSAVFKSTIGNDRDAAFEVSNIGQVSNCAETESDCQWRMGRVTFSRSSVMSGSAVTMSIVSGGDGALTIGFSWKEGVVEDSLVELLIGEIKGYSETLVNNGTGP